jgi:V/A-type H+-transporting ATPase subunit K
MDVTPRKPLPALPLALTLLAAVLAGGATLLAVIAPAALAQQAAGRGVPPEVWTWGLVSAALATGLSSLAAGYAVAKLGTAAVGALAEKPDLFGRLLIFVGLAEGIAIYGVIISILILNRLT